MVNVWLVVGSVITEVVGKFLVAVSIRRAFTWSGVRFWLPRRAAAAPLATPAAILVPFRLKYFETSPAVGVRSYDASGTIPVDSVVSSVAPGARIEKILLPGATRSGFAT